MMCWNVVIYIFSHMLYILKRFWPQLQYHAAFVPEGTSGAGHNHYGTVTSHCNIIRQCYRTCGVTWLLFTSGQFTLGYFFSCNWMKRSAVLQSLETLPPIALSPYFSITPGPFLYYPTLFFHSYTPSLLLSYLIPLSPYPPPFSLYPFPLSPIVPYRHGGGRSKKINAWYLNTLMVYL